MNWRTAVGWDQVDAQATPTYATVTFGHTYNNVNQRSYQTVDDNSWWYYPAASASTTSYTANNMNQYTAVGGVSPTYDLKGNLTSAGTGFTFTYDAENRMLSAANDITYKHDARGWRKSKTLGSTTTIYVTDADNRELVEYDGSNGHVLRRYVYGNGIDEALNQVDVSNTSGSRPRTTLIPDIQGSSSARWVRAVHR